MKTERERCDEIISRCTHDGLAAAARQAKIDDPTAPEDALGANMLGYLLQYVIVEAVDRGASPTAVVSGVAAALARAAQICGCSKHAEEILYEIGAGALRVLRRIDAGLDRDPKGPDSDPAQLAAFADFLAAEPQGEA